MLRSHAHITLINNYEMVLFDSVFHDTDRSVNDYLNIIYGSFNVKNPNRISVESKMQKIVELNERWLLYFCIGDSYYVWMTCNKCYPYSMN